MNRIIAGNSYTPLDTFTLSDPGGGPFELAGSTLVLTISTPGGTTALTQTLAVDVYGTATVSDGLTLGSGGSGAGVIVQSLTSAQTAALPRGLLTWVLTLTDSDGKISTPLRGQLRVVDAAYLDAVLTRRELRRRIADRLGDLVLLDATEESPSNTTFVDALNISGAADNLTGRQFVVATGANAGHVARITASSESTNRIDFTPAAPTVFSPGDTLEVVNERSRGWSIAEYNRTINAAINDAWPLAAAKLAASITGEFSQGNPTIAIPEVMDEVAGVSWQDPNNATWLPITRTEPFYGWTADPTSGTVTLRGRPGLLAEGRALRLLGYGPHPTLETDDDVTALNPEWLVAECCYRLAVSGADRDGARANTILLYKQEREVLRARIRTIRPSGTVRVRA